MIEVEKLSKSYGSLVAVKDISFEVGQGKVVGFLGPNGAGKSTTLRVLAGFLGATSGRVRIAGFDIAEERMKALEKIGYMPESAPLYPEMKVSEYLLFRAEVKGLRGRAGRRREIERASALAKVDDMLRMRIGHLSKGYRQRVGLADALLGSPPLLILDEPSAGLDPNQIREVRQLIRDLASEHTILLSTHILSEVEAICDEAVVIAKGRLVASGTLASLVHGKAGGATEGSGGREPRLRLQLGEKAAKAGAVFEQQPQVVHYEKAGSDGSSQWLVALRANGRAEAAEELVAALVAAGIGVRAVVPVASSLEQVFAKLTGEPRQEQEL